MGSSGDASSPRWRRWGSTRSEIDEGRAIRGRRFGGRGAGVAGVRRHPRRRARDRGGAHDLAPRLAGAAARRRARLAAARRQPRRDRERAKNSARDVDLNRNFPAHLRDEHAPGYFPGAGAAVRTGDAGHRRPDRARDRRRRRGGARPVRLRELRRPGGRVGRGRRRCLRLAGARGHRLPDPGVAGKLAGTSIAGCPVLTLELPAGPLSRFREPRGGRSGRIDTRRAGCKRVNCLTGGAGRVSWPPSNQSRRPFGQWSLYRPTAPRLNRTWTRKSSARSSTRCEGAGLAALRPQDPARGGCGLRPGARGARAGGGDRRPRDHAQGRQRRRAAAVHRGRDPAAAGAGQDRRRGRRRRAGVPRSLRRGLHAASTRS